MAKLCSKALAKLATVLANGWGITFAKVVSKGPSTGLMWWANDATALPIELTVLHTVLKALENPVALGHDLRTR